MTTATDVFYKRKVQPEMVTIGKDSTLTIYRHIFTATVDASKQDCLKARGTRSAIFACKATIFACKAKEEELNPTINCVQDGAKCVACLWPVAVRIF